MNRIDNYMKSDGDYKFGNRSNYDDEETRQKYMERINHYEDESVESTNRALRMLNETETIGNETARNLNYQGEKLRNIETQLDDINDNLTATQKNINQIKSVFGGIKNRFFSWSNDKNMPKSESFDKQKQQTTTNNKPQAYQQQAQAKPEFTKITNSAREKQFEDNLDLMSDSLARLNSLAKEMSNELDRQNPLIDRLDEKTKRTNARIEDQNKQMKKIK